MARFGAVGIINTAVNFAVLNFAFYALHQNRYMASVIATGVAVLVSFSLNRSFVFGSNGRPVQQLLLFVAVTLSGVLLVQNLVYAAASNVIDGHAEGLVQLIQSVSGLQLAASFVTINLSNVLGALGAMAWNYNGYRLFVFKPNKVTKREPIDETLAQAEETA